MRAGTGQVETGMTDPSVHGPAFARRWLCFFLFWIMLGRVSALDLGAGAVICALAAGASLALMAPGTGRAKPAALLAFATRFARRSVIAGWDVGLRAFQTPVPLQPGFITFATRCPRGVELQSFCAVTALQPGTLPLGDSDAGLLLHCLDTGGRVHDALRQDEAAFRAAIDAGARHG
ncbi:Na+/H+ antiporter subunit E [Roseixanthobacter glucoisosaccharinicivorans]|uniref:Na+/H+ antiporter subunit E n=1 Tax=Roseixanthobacter glucoisosaccharinicivorans TaxID=3119923 RepID=UPI0037297987